MAEHNVVVVSTDGTDVDSVEAALSSDGTPVRVRHLTGLEDIYHVLTNEVVHCLVLPARVDGADAIPFCYGVRGFFPELPVVVAGHPTEAVPDDLAVTGVAADSFSDDAVVAAVTSAIDGDVDSDAARPPSRIETLFLSMLDQFPFNLYAKDEEARHVIASGIHKSPAEFVGLTDLEFRGLPEEFREPSYHDDLSVIEGEEERIDVEGYVDFLESYTRTTKVPWYDADGDVIGLAGVSWDVTERKEREQASRRQLELLVKVALIAAHEFRNELQIASGRLELLEDDAENVGADAEHVQVIADSQRRLSRIVDKVIGLASEEQPKHHPEEVWLSMVSREVWGTLDDGDATLDVRDDLGFVADQESTSLLFQILFKNAIQHGGEDVTVEVGSVDGGFYVADDGDGIDAEPPERVFDAGFTTDPDNTGFGLYVARSIAKEHGWTMRIEESETGGARFEIVGPTMEDVDTEHGKRDESDGD